MQARAGYWYEKAQPNLVGDFAKARVAKRLAEVHDALPLDMAAVAGDYRLQLQITKAAAMDRAIIGKAESLTLTLHPDGTGAATSLDGTLVRNGKWTMADKRVTFVYADPSLGRATLLVTKTRQGITLNGVRGWKDRAQVWQATKQ